MFTTISNVQHFCLLTHFFPDTDPSVCKHCIVLSHMAICSIISSQFFSYDLVRNCFGQTSELKNSQFANKWTVERFLNLRNLTFWDFSCICKTLWVHYDDINIINTIWEYLFSREQPIKWQLDKPMQICVIIQWKKIFLIPQNHTFQDRNLPFMSHDVNMQIIKQLQTVPYCSPFSLVHITTKRKNYSQILMAVWVVEEPHRSGFGHKIAVWWRPGIKRVKGVKYWTTSPDGLIVQVTHS